MTTTAYPVDHPLDPSEVELAREVLGEAVELTDRAQFIDLDLDEPSKDELRRYGPPTWTQPPSTRIASDVT